MVRALTGLQRAAHWGFREGMGHYSCVCVCVLKLKLRMLGDTQTFGVFRRCHCFYLKVTVAAALKHFLTVSSVVASSAPVQSVNANTVSRNVLLSIYIPV